MTCFSASSGAPSLALFCTREYLYLLAQVADLPCLRAA